MTRAAKVPTLVAPFKAKATVARHAPGITLQTNELALEQHAEQLARASRGRQSFPSDSASLAAATNQTDDLLHRFAAAHGYDLSSIRIHTDASAAAVADAFQARALTRGRDIYFARGEYRPQSSAGRELIAHELTHAVQQSLSAIGPRVQRACRPLSTPFDLAASNIGQAIHAALSQVTIVVPGATPDDPSTTVPRVNPDQVIALLGASSCFQRDASAVEQAYCRGQSGCAARLNLDFHSDAEKGSEFLPGAAGVLPALRVEVTTLPYVIRHIVHEIGHAVPSRRRGSWPTPVTRGWGRNGGAVTRSVRTRLREESRTRGRENEVMQEIQGSPLWARYVGRTRVPAALAQPQQVRSSFVSGRPKLTYQENFIIDAMKRRYRSALRGTTEDRITQAARGVLGEGFASPRVANLTNYTTTAALIGTHQTRLRQPLPERAPPLPAVGDCIEIYNRFERNLSRARADLVARHRQCPAFITFFQRNLAIPFSVRNPAGERRVYDLWNTMRDRFAQRMSARRASASYTRWYDAWMQSLSQQDQRDQQLQRSVLRYFSWVLIAEAMSREWQSHTTVDRAIQRQHLELLIAAGGARRAGALTGVRWLLSGITMPPSGGTP